LNILDFSNMCWCTPHLYNMPLLWAKHAKIVWHVIHPLLRIYLVHLVIPHMNQAHSWKSNDFDACMVPLLLLCLKWSSGGIWHVCGLVNLVLNLESELKVFNSTWTR
jgi:hypothetical protein